MRTGVYGGSFNPKHNGHLALAKAFLQSGKVDEVWLIVSPQNPLKINAELMPDEKRLAMAQAAVLGEKHIRVSDYEFHLERPSYMVNTLQHLSADFPQHTFTLLIGSDNWTCFDRWHKHEEILNRYPIVIYPRTGDDVDATTLPPNVSVINTPRIDISSTEIRKKLSLSEDIHGLVPEKVRKMLISSGGNE